MLNSIELIADYPLNHAKHWKTGNRAVVWGWKRQLGKQNRLVYFSGHLQRKSGGVHLGAACFYYRAALTPGEETKFVGDLGKAANGLRSVFDQVDIDRRKRGNLINFEMLAGRPMPVDKDRIDGLKRQRGTNNPQAIRYQRELTCMPETPFVFPADLYVGSDFSVEANLPAADTIAKYFCLHQSGGKKPLVGGNDPLLRALARNPVDRLAKFCTLHSAALIAEPSSAMQQVVGHLRSGWIRQVFSDSADRLLDRAGAPTQLVRPDPTVAGKYEARFRSPHLIVAGLTHDTMKLLPEARLCGIQVVVANPAPASRLDYLRPGDLYFKTSTEQFLEQVSAPLLRRCA